ncbi:MAG: hypothetical protein FWF46_04465 [Oscillospiraceae bacterium]|nr:hypothetical protein [Oscillospiraceae bacterium]
MQKEITVREVETTLNDCEDIVEPIIVKRTNKKDVMIISIDEYQKNQYLSELSSKVAKGGKFSVGKFTQHSKKI